MPHSLDPADLLYPNGDLPLTLFPDKTEGKTAIDALQLWLNDAQEKVATVPEGSQDDAARHYVYAKAYHAAASRIRAMPNSKSHGGQPMSIIEQWGADRVKSWEDKAIAEYALYNALLPIPIIPLPPRAVSGSTRIRPVF
jgi:hypothetical protein